ncbi:DinI family protein [Salmonella enterica subsp. salamae]|uniref:DinI family protein n=10 Tax=Salmonella enterica TaxID=28901 RepID=A0A344R0M3_SALER|nr:DinI-like family protein [Salmonella enterica]EAA4438895.1 DinI family protein [Salmonella enterica subsp. salamae]EBI0478736.1 DinI family protein [Salmonella enterica subsp. enterica serovar Braenderup]ECG1422846.1 DinI family protein [Salmonella enterica subsp. salamae str. CFSAN000559]ECI2502117.1 DinI family protein [Salmonella enterica subsp. enterica serovar Enteritidis]EDU6436143.1 DinI family protein [Salmonella enterica subsp. salamae serovar 47:b:e,n,x,z15]EDX4960459.1 DinI fami
MFAELVYDKRNLGELSKGGHQIFPNADVRVNPMMTLPAINTDASKHEEERISRTVQEMFKEADMRLVSECPMDSLSIGTKSC